MDGTGLRAGEGTPAHGGGAGEATGADALFAGPGEMRALCRALDWSATPLGAPDRWPAALRTVVRLCLDSPFPVNLWCGPDLILVYNDAYRRVLGAKHPRALGRPGLEVWADVRADVEPMFAQIRAGGPPIFAEDARFVMTRAGDDEAGAEAYFTFGLSAVRDEAGEIVAFFNPAAETTARVLVDRRLAEANHALELERARLVDTLESITDPFFLVDPDWRFTYINPAAEVVVGRPRAELLGKGLWDEFPEAVGTPYHEHAQTAVRERRAVDFEAYYPPPLDIWTAMRIYPLGTAEAPEGAAVYYQNVSARVRTEAERERLLAELRVERERLEHVFRRAPTFLAVLRGPAHVFERVNDAYRRLVGDRPLEGLAVADALPEVREQGFVELLDQVLATGEPFVGREVPVQLARTPDAPPEERFVDFVYLPLVEAGGARTGVIAHGTDVTEQVRARRETERLLRESEAAHAALAASEARLRDVFEQAPVAVAVLSGPEHVYTVMSPRYAGYIPPGKAALGRPVREALPELQGQGVAELMDRVYETGEPFFGRERLVRLDRDHDGVPEEYYFDVGYQPLRDANGTVYAIASVSQEVTAHVLARRELEAAREAAEAANAAKSEFLSTMSHELRTPLNAIQGYTELLALGLRGPLTESQQQDLERVRRANQHLTGLVTDILNFARLEAGQVEFHVADVELADVVGDIESLVGPQLAAKALTFTHDACAPDTPEEPHVVRADAEKLRQILLNLLTNAIKFTDAGGAVRMLCETDAAAGVVRMHVSDTGRGIPADQLGRIFEPFVQVDRHRTQASQQGVGLGLAISRDLARGMGGDLTVESEEGKGSTFTVTLRAAARTR